jgi:hypothetical protein
MYIIMFNIKEKHFSISIVPVRSRDGSIVALTFDHHLLCNWAKSIYKFNALNFFWIT